MEMEQDGFLNLFKPQGITSFDVIRRIKPLLWKKAKIGHAGVVDKPASGVLPVGIGRATKLFDALSGYTKDYYAWIAFGADSPTLDFGSDLSPKAAPESTESAVALAGRIIECLDSFKGKIKQAPPSFSNVKVEGKELYKYKLDDEEVNVKPRRINIEKLSLLSFHYFDGEKIEKLNVEGATINRKPGGYVLPKLAFEIPAEYASPSLLAEAFVECETGTYVRALARDIGAAAETGGVVAALVRTRVGPFNHTESVSLEDFAAALETGIDGAISKYLIPMSVVVPTNKKLVVMLEEAKNLSKGNYIIVQEHRLPQDYGSLTPEQGGVFAVLEDGRLVAECISYEKQASPGLWVVKPAKVYLK